jgi:hypothetical protein
VGEPEETGTATMTVAVPPGVPGAWVIVFGVVMPPCVIVWVVVATGVGVTLGEAVVDAAVT